MKIVVEGCENSQGLRNYQGALLHFVAAAAVLLPVSDLQL